MEKKVAGEMIAKISDYILSPLAMGTHANYMAVKEGKSMLRRYDSLWGMKGPFTVSLFESDAIAAACAEEGIGQDAYSKFECISIIAAARALRLCPEINPADESVIFIISTTKGGWAGEGDPLPAESAGKIAGRFGNPNRPLVICNACISGLCAQTEAAAALESGRWKHAVVIGADTLTPFILSGFCSLNATSQQPCRPFDEERCGLNLGEAAACIIYGERSPEECRGAGWHIVSGALSNDAFHVTNPSKNADGAYIALRSTLKGADMQDIAFINVHGTATLFNDEMEAVAIDRAEIAELPVNGLKGFFGHTLGAAGIIETLISMEAVEDKTVLATKGFDSLGVSKKTNISGLNRKAHGNAFIKMMSGFGGCNAAMLFSMKKEEERVEKTDRTSARLDITHKITVTPQEVIIDGLSLQTEMKGGQILKEMYRKYVKDYPRFYKMDPLCKLGFIASELLLDAESKAEGTTRFSGNRNRGVLLVGSKGSICADMAYLQTIRHPENYYPSPSAFIYTLPNIVTGEIAIRNGYHGATSYIMMQDGESELEQLMLQALLYYKMDSLVGGVIEMEGPEKFKAVLHIARRRAEQSTNEVIKK